ncbi:MAG: COX15/CtaA family protein [Candidatus Zixiibacteriota bacterium]
MKAFRRLAFVATIATYLLIFMGGLVRVSGAGLGCPDWPRCFGRWIPPLSAADLPSGIDPAQFNFTLAWIEYFNRLCGVTVGLLILATAIVALAKFRREARIVWPSLAAALLTAYQGWQGGRVVASELQPLLVSAHLLISFLIVSLLMYVMQRTYFMGEATSGEESTYPRHARAWAVFLWIGALLQIILGTQVRSGIETVSREFPLLSDLQWLSRVGAAYDLHMISGTLLALATWVIGFAIVKMASHPTGMVRRVVWGMMLVMLGQVLLGLALATAGLTPVLQLFHLWLAGVYIGLALMLYFGLGQKAAVVSDYGKGLARVAAPIAGLVMLAVIAALAVTRQAEASRQNIPVLYDVPSFSFVERNGEPFGLAELKGKISVVDFIFTSCRGPCPYMSASFAELYRQYAHSDKVQLVSFTVDPDTDSLPVLREYAARFGVTDNRWRFVRARTDQISQFCEEGFKVSGDLPGMHSTKFILVDGNARIRGYFDYDSPAAIESLRSQIQQLVRELP